MQGSITFHVQSLKFNSRQGKTPSAIVLSVMSTLQKKKKTSIDSNSPINYTYITMMHYYYTQDMHTNTALILHLICKELRNIISIFIIEIVSMFPCTKCRYIYDEIHKTFVPIHYLKWTIIIMESRLSIIKLFLDPKNITFDVLLTDLLILDSRQPS